MSDVLFILVEGNDDERFFAGVVVPVLKQKYNKVVIWQHAQKSNQAIEKMLISIQTMGADYFYVVDLDREDKIEDKKEIVIGRLEEICGKKIVIAVKEIEGWYLAGLGIEASRKLDVAYLERTDDIYKEDFNRLLPLAEKGSRISIMHEILKYFSVETARSKNASFDFFWSNFIEKLT